MRRLASTGGIAETPIWRTFPSDLQIRFTLPFRETITIHANRAHAVREPRVERLGFENVGKPERQAQRLKGGTGASREGSGNEGVGEHVRSRFHGRR
jgi:hypothetical protein